MATSERRFPFSFHAWPVWKQVRSRDWFGSEGNGGLVCAESDEATANAAIEIVLVLVLVLVLDFLISRTRTRTRTRTKGNIMAAPLPARSKNPPTRDRRRCN